MGTIARYTEASPMSIHVTSLSASSLELMREAHLVFARALGLAFAATVLLILDGEVRTLPGMAGLTLFTGLVVALERLLAGNHPYPRLGAANRITLARAGVACLIASRALDPAPFGTSERWMLVALAGCALLLDGTDGWAARRRPVLGAGDRRDALPLSLRRSSVPGLAPPAAGTRIRRSPPQDDRGRAEPGTALRARPVDTPGMGCRGLRAGAGPADLFLCRRHRHTAVRRTT